jgi:hypothetical protein
MDALLSPNVSDSVINPHSIINEAIIDGSFSGWQKNYVESAKPTFKNNSVDSGRNISEDYTGDYYYYYYYDNPYQMDTREWQVPIFSYLYTGIALLTILVNIMVIYVFAIKKMRSQTTFFLSSLACSDSVICFSVAIYHIHFHLLENYRHPVKLEWCIVKRVIYILEQMARSSSNWITAFLGIQRFVCICFPFRARTLCSIKTSILAVTFSVVVGISVYIYEAISVKVIAWPVMNGSVYLYEGCVLTPGEGVTERSIMIHYILSGLISRVLPCLVLFVTTLLLAKKLKNRKRGIAADVQDKNKSSSQMKRLNALVFIILVIFLCAELQDAIAFSIYVYELAADKIREVVSREADDYWDTWGSLLSLVGYHCNFWIFFLMSSQFRSAFYETCSSVRNINTFTKTTSLSSEDIVAVKPLRGE